METNTENDERPYDLVYKDFTLNLKGLTSNSDINYNI